MIKVIDPVKYIRDNKLEGPVTSSQIFSGGTFNFHPKGLMSEEIFGLEGSVDRRKAMSWMELNCNIIHPVLYDIIAKRIERRIPVMLSGEKTFDIGPDGEFVDPPEGEEGEIDGITSFIQNIKRFKFRNPEGQRGKTIGVFYENIENGTFFMNKLLLISPDYRPVEVREVGRTEVVAHEMTKLYRRIMDLSNQLKSVSGAVFDVLSYQMQLLIMQVFELVKLRTSKKQGMIRRMMLGKRVDFSGRAVIAPNPELKIGEVGLPFRMCCSMFENQLIYGIANSPYSRYIPEEFYAESKKYLGKESSFDID